MSSLKSSWLPGWVVLILLSGSATWGGNAGNGPVWPLDLEPRYLTSNFMEHRSGRFHAGLDFKTEERPGHPVRAVCDGWISRIRFTPGGYGKALYLRGNDGRTYVYAHLERLADGLREQVELAQRTRGRWDVALQFPAGRHAVHAGDVLALSGESGTAGPHLHFEVRDPANRPLDPQAAGFAVADTIAPVLLRIRVLPASPETMIEGGDVACAVGDGRTPLAGDLGTVRVRGPVAFTCRVVEVADVRGHSLEPWRLALSVDDSLVFESRNEGFAFEHNDRARLMWLDGPDGRERWLHVRPGDDLPGRTGGPWGTDPAVMSPGRHRLQLLAEDRAGNRAEVSWIVDVDGTGAGPGWPAAPHRLELDPPCEGVRWLSPLVAGLESGRCVSGEDLARSLGRPVCAVIDSGAFTAEETRTMARAQGLTPLAGVLRVRAVDWPTAQTIPVATGWSDTLAAEVGLFLETSRGWSYAGRPRRSRDTRERWVVDVGGSGRFALLRDGTPPYLGPGPDEGLIGPGGGQVDPAVAPPGWAIFPVRLEDLGSGVDPDTIVATWDGASLIVEPDMPRRRILVGPPTEAVAGVHILTLGAADRAGHVVERTYEIRLDSE